MNEIPKDARVYVAGHQGLVGSAILRRLDAEMTGSVLVATHDELDLRDPAAVDAWFADNRPEYVFLAAGTVGGILANVTRPVEFIHDNLMIHASVLPAAHRHGVRRLLYLGSACIYPRECPQPIREEYLLSGPLEPTNQPYAIAKIAGVELCQAYRRQHGSDFVAVMPTNLYGPNDNFDARTSHVVPALIRKFHEAKAEGRRKVTLWGTGTPRREFMHVDDLADACLFLMSNWRGQRHINIGTGEDVSIRELAEIVRARVYPEADIELDLSKPDGMPRRVLDVTRLHALGWRHTVLLEDGIGSTYRWFLDNHDRLRHGRGADQPASTQRA